MKIVSEIAALQVGTELSGVITPQKHDRGGMPAKKKRKLSAQKSSRKANRPTKKNKKVVHHTAKNRKMKKPRTRNRHHGGIGRQEKKIIL